MTCFYQALLVLVWFRKGEDLLLLGAGFAISRATAYRYRDEGIAVLADQAQDLHTALRRAAADGWTHVILDGKLFDCDRLTETTTSVKGEAIDAWYSGKHRDFGANIPAIMRPDGLPIWTSPAMPGHLHDTSCARELGVTAALNWSATELGLPTLADSGYESTGHGIKTPVKQPTGGNRLAIGNRSYNRLLRGLRWQGQRGFAILIGRWKALRHTTISPRRIGDILAGALDLTHFEYKYLPEPCRDHFSDTAAICRFESRMTGSAGVLRLRGPISQAVADAVPGQVHAVRHPRSTGWNLDVVPTERRLGMHRPLCSTSQVTDKSFGVTLCSQALPLQTRRPT